MVQRRPRTSAPGSPGRVLGVDPGSRVCGYGVVDVDLRGQTRYVECGVLRARQSDALAERLADIAA